MNDTAATIELNRLLTAALALADGLGLTMVAIHLDEACNLLASEAPTPTH